MIECAKRESCLANTEIIINGEHYDFAGCEARPGDESCVARKAQFDALLDPPTVSKGLGCVPSEAVIVRIGSRGLELWRQDFYINVPGGGEYHG